jgi:hypothetical protein
MEGNRGKSKHLRRAKLATSPTLMKMVGMALLPEDTTRSLTNVTQSEQRQLNDFKPEARLFKRNSAESNGVVRLWPLRL